MIHFQNFTSNTPSPLFQAVQAQAIFLDSKTFVDGVPKQAPEVIEALFQEQKGEENFDLQAFVTEHFELPKPFGAGFESDTSRSIDLHIQTLWPVLTREADQPSEHGTLLPLPFPYVVPGGRFGEVYYWDSYFTMLGLQVHGRTDLIRHMVNNFAYLLDTYGLIPNGNRTYYLGRSQPPYFAQMVCLLAEALPQEPILLQYLPQLEKEYAFWMRTDSSTDEASYRVLPLPGGALLNRYWDEYDTPRPESYKEDVAIAQLASQTPATVYRHLRAGAESGWDYSSRWLQDGQHLSSIHTTDIAPIDLNCLLYLLEQTLSEAYQVQNNEEKTIEFAEKAEARKQAILDYCWHETKGFFFDYDAVNQEQKAICSLAGVYPLWAGIATEAQAQQVAQQLEKEFLKPGGLVTTLSHTHEQWDAPNGWAPLQWTAYVGLLNYGFTELAETIKTRWITTCISTYEATGKLLEKYNVETQTQGGGGEYPTQDGFGWTNGVLAKLLSL
ncbi:MAG: alpha,alpha-trehalase TreF [Spirosomataceae bacterium]